MWGHSPSSEDKAFGCSRPCVCHPRVQIRDALSPRSPGTATDPGWCKPSRGLPHNPATFPACRGRANAAAGHCPPPRVSLAGGTRRSVRLKAAGFVLYPFKGANYTPLEDL